MSKVTKCAGLLKVLEAVGGPSALGHRLGISHAAVCQWQKVPLERVPSISRITGLRPEIIRPDFFRDLHDVGGEAA